MSGLRCGDRRSCSLPAMRIRAFEHLGWPPASCDELVAYTTWRSAPQASGAPSDDRDYSGPQTKPHRARESTHQVASAAERDGVAASNHVGADWGLVLPLAAAASRLRDADHTWISSTGSANWLTAFTLYITLLLSTLHCTTGYLPSYFASSPFETSFDGIFRTRGPPHPTRKARRCSTIQ